MRLRVKKSFMLHCTCNDILGHIISSVALHLLTVRFLNFIHSSSVTWSNPRPGSRTSGEGGIHRGQFTISA